MRVFGRDARDAALMLATLAIGLAVDVYTDLPGQMAVSAAVWLVFFHVVRHIEAQERQALFTCLVIATAGELFFFLFLQGTSATGTRGASAQNSS